MCQCGWLCLLRYHSNCIYLKCVQLQYFELLQTESTEANVVSSENTTNQIQPFCSDWLTTGVMKSGQQSCQRWIFLRINHRSRSMSVVPWYGGDEGRGEWFWRTFHYHFSYPGSSMIKNDAQIFINFRSGSKQIWQKVWCQNWLA